MQGELWFNQFIWLIFIMPFVGLLAAGLSKREDPAIEGDRVLRHDKPARFSHWTHAIGTLFLLLSGIILGTRFTPSFVAEDGAAAWFNVHFVFALFFLFGTFYWLGNTLISRYRFREHLPKKYAVKYIINHYGSMLGIKGLKMPAEEKYFESERVAFIVALIATIGVLTTGLVKVLAHLVNVSEGFMNVITWGHDISAALMLLFFLAHIFFGALAPFAWKTFPSMIHGYVKLEDAEHEHQAWIEELKNQNTVEVAEATVTKNTKDPSDKEGVCLNAQVEGVEHV